MWFTLRWLEDCLSSLRAAIALLSMLAIGKTRLKEIRKQREELRERVVKVAVERAELPEDPDVFVKLAKERRMKDKGGKVGRLGYFSLRRRRKKDYNEVRRVLAISIRRSAYHRHLIVYLCLLADHVSLGSVRVCYVGSQKKSIQAAWKYLEPQ